MRCDCPTTGLTRRLVLKGAGGIALTALLPACSNSTAPPSQGGVPTTPTVPARFLSDAELITLRAFVDRLIPEDTQPGAVIACCAEAIDQLLGAFLTEPAFIYAGAPYSDRGGNPGNDFLAFVPLDPYEELAWRIEIEGSQGLAAREFNGPVKGLQAIYREGLAALDEVAQGNGQADFASAPAPVRDQVIGSGDPAIDALVDVGFPDTLDAMYGPPEYGGNCDLVGWSNNNYDGDVQPRGYTAEQVVNADNPGLFDALLPPSYHEPQENQQPGPVLNKSAQRAPSLPLAPGSEQIVGAMHAANGRLGGLRLALRPLAQQQRQRIREIARA